MKNTKLIISCLLSAAVAIIVYIWFFSPIKTNDYNFNQNTYKTISSQFAALQSTYLNHQLELKNHEAILKQKEKNIDVLKTWYVNELKRIKLLATDQRMEYVASYLQCPDELKKLIFNNDTLIGFDECQFVDLSTILTETDYNSMLIDSLYSLSNEYNIEKDIFYKTIDNLRQQLANRDSRISITEDELKTMTNNLSDAKKETKKQKRKSFFNGLGAGICASIAGVVIFIIAM